MTMLEVSARSALRSNRWMAQYCRQRAVNSTLRAGWLSMATKSYLAALRNVEEIRDAREQEALTVAYLASVRERNNAHVG